MKPSYKAAQLRPYIRAAESFINANGTDRYTRWSIDRLTSLLRNAGPVRSIGDFPLLSPREKALTSIAMLREKPVPPSRILAVTLGISCVLLEDTYGPGGDLKLFRSVQLAKALRRRASGTHVVYETGARFDRYPPSTGRFLAVMGEMVEEAAEFSIQENSPAVLLLKQERFGPLPVAPKATIAKSRYGNSRVPPPPPDPVSLWEQSKTAQREAEKREAERISRELQQAFAREGYAVFGRKEDR